MDDESLFDNNGDGIADGFNMNARPDPDGTFGTDTLPNFPDPNFPNLDPPGSNPLNLDVKQLIATIQAQFAQPDSTVCKAPTCYDKDFTDDLKVLGFTGTYCVVPSKAKVCHKSSSTTSCNTSPYTLEDIMSRQIKPSGCLTGTCTR